MRGDLRIPTLQDRVAPGGVPEARGLEDVGIARGAGIAAAGLAQRIEALGQGLLRRAAQDTEDAAWEAGTTAGDLEPGTQMEGGGRVARTAFNRAAADAGQRRLEITTRAELDRLAQQHATDPEGFQAAAAQWRDGMASSLPPTLATRFSTGFDTLALPVFGQIRTAQRRAVADQAVATWTEALPARIAGIEQAAGVALTDPAAARSYRLQEDQAVAELIALGPQEGFTLGGRTYPPDPSRTGALSLAQIAQRSEALRAQGREAVVVGAWRAAGGGRAWIESFERGSRFTGPDADWLQRNAATGRPLGTPEAMAARVPAAWQPTIAEAAAANRLDPALFTALIGLESGGRAGAVSRAGAVGPAQIMPATAANPGFGLPPLPEDALRDPARAIPWGARYLGALRDYFRGDMAKAVAAYNAGAGAVERAARDGRLLPEETRNYVRTLLPAVAGGGMPLQDNETQRIATRLRGLAAADEATEAQGRAEARALITTQLRENDAAIGVSGRPVRTIDPELAVRAGFDPVELDQRQRTAIERFSAGQVAANTTDPAELARLAESFAPGTENFRADPQAAAQLLASLRGRGVTVQGAALTERVRDLETEAQATGRATAIGDDEGRAAGLTPERLAEINRGVALTAEISRLRQDGAAIAPADRADAVGRFPVEGPEARENALRLRALAEAFERRDRAVADDPAAYAMSVSAPLRQLAAEVTGGGMARLPELIALSRAEQQRLGVPDAEIRAVPKPFAQAIAQNLAALPDDAQRMQRLLTMTSGVAEPEARRQVLNALAEAGTPAHLVNAARIAPRVGPALAARIASELGTELRTLQLQPTQQRDIRDTVTGVWTNSDRLGGLREAQLQATGNAAFVQIAQSEKGQLTHIATVRGASDGSIASSAVRDAYGQLYGGVQVVNRPRDQVLAAVPTGTDADALARGLRGVLDGALQALPAAERARFGRGVWTDAGVGRLAFYPEGSPLPLARPDGQPLLVTVADALATPQAAAPARTNDTERRAQQRAMEQRGRELGRESRTLMRPVDQ